MKLLGVSSPKSSAVSLDLLNLYFVNQISTKKTSIKNMKKPVHIDITTNPPVRRHNIELPMSPLRTQHKSDLDHIQNRLQKQVLDSRRQHLAEKVKYQHNPGNSSDQDPWIIKPPSQGIFRKADTAPQELFKILHRLDYMNSARKNPVIMTSNGSEIREGIKEPLFDVKETAEQKTPQDGSDCSFLALFEDESKPIHKNPSTKHFNPFVNQSNTDLYFIDSDNRNQMANTNYPYDTREDYPESSAKKHAVDRHLEGIFTAPEQVLFKSNNVSSASYKKTSGHCKTHLQDCHEGQHYFIPSEKKEKIAHLEKTETFAYHHDPEINIKENEQHYSRNKRFRNKFKALSSGKHFMVTKDKIKTEGKKVTSNSEKSHTLILKENKNTGEDITYQGTVFAPLSDHESVKKSVWSQNQLFGLEEFTTAQEEESKFGVISNLHKMEKGVETSVSRQSLSYFPGQTESCVSSSPDTFEEEDTDQRKEYLNEQSLKISDANVASASASTEPLKTSDTRTMLLQPISILTREEANHIQEKASILCTTEQENKNHTSPSEGSSSHQALKREPVPCSVTCDAWSQTESSVTEVRKVDVATQCGTMEVGSCDCSLLSACSPGKVPPPSTRSTTEGLKTSGREALEPVGMGSTAGIAAFSSEAEYLSLAGRRTLEVLNYIDIMKEREKQ